MPRQPKQSKQVTTLTHEEASRRNIPTAEYQALLGSDARSPVPVAYERRNRDLDPQLVWRGKDEQDWSDLVVPAPPLFIQEKLHPKVLIDDLLRRSREADAEAAGEAGGQVDLFADFNGLPSDDARAEFYQHDANWSNRMILGDSLQVMASLAEREGLRGKVQCIYIDPPYGIKFNSNFQWSTTSRDVKDGKAEHITREPEQVKAFRDTWRDGIHSYLTYLRDRLTVARDLLTDSGSVFVQIGDENVHRVRAVMDEVFGEENFVSEIVVNKTTSATSRYLAGTCDYILWSARNVEQLKYRQPFREKRPGETGATLYNRVQSVDGQTVRTLSSSESYGKDVSTDDWHLVTSDNILSQSGGESTRQPILFRGETYRPASGGWKTNVDGMTRLVLAGRLAKGGKALRYIRRIEDFRVSPVSNVWDDMLTGSFTENKLYVVQTAQKLVQRCILMTTDPGDLVLDPTCGSGTTAYVAEQWGRRWITIDTSRVALALARARVMGARYPYYLLADSPEGQAKEAELSRKAPSEAPTQGDIRQGFVCERVPHVTLKSIANNAEIDIIWEKHQQELEPLRRKLNEATGSNWEEWGIPRHAETLWSAAAQKLFAKLRTELDAPAGTASEGHNHPDVALRTGKPRDDSKVQRLLRDLNATLKRSYTLDALPPRPADPWEQTPSALHGEWRRQRIARQQEIDASIAAKADYEYLYDKPYQDGKKVRVAGPFTVESLSPHRILGVDENDELIDRVADTRLGYNRQRDFTATILENLRTAGVQQAHKADKIAFSSIVPWQGELVCAEGRYANGGGQTQGGKAVGERAGGERLGTEQRAGIFIGPEFGTVTRPDLVVAAREAADAGFDLLIACAFNYEAHASELSKLGRVPVLKAHMNADLHMAEDLKNTGKGNLFVIFGEPDIDILPVEKDSPNSGQVQVKVNGVDVFHPNTGEIRSDGPEGIACWFIDTDYNEESFFVRHAYFLGAADPYKSLKTTLKAEINPDAWATLNSDTSRQFEKPQSGRIAVKVINHLGDEVMKVFRV